MCHISIISEGSLPRLSSSTKFFSSFCVNDPSFSNDGVNRSDEGKCLLECLFPVGFSYPFLI